MFVNEQVEKLVFDSWFQSPLVCKQFVGNLGQRVGIEVFETVVVRSPLLRKESVPKENCRSTEVFISLASQHERSGVSKP